MHYCKLNGLQIIHGRFSAYAQAVVVPVYRILPVGIYSPYPDRRIKAIGLLVAISILKDVRVIQIAPMEYAPSQDVRNLFHYIDRTEHLNFVSAHSRRVRCHGEHLAALWIATGISSQNTVSRTTVMDIMSIGGQCNEVLVRILPCGYA